MLLVVVWWECESELLPGRDSPKLLNVAAGHLLNQFGSRILFWFPFVMGRREAGFDYPDICDSPILVSQLPESLLAEILLHKQLVDTGVKTLLKKLLNNYDPPPSFKVYTSTALTL
jgi:hypothetical protein